MHGVRASGITSYTDKKTISEKEIEMHIYIAAALTSTSEELPHYSFLNLALMFFIFCVMGWVWEVIYTAVTEKVVAKRGMLHGPWLPLYGVGGVLILLLLNPFKSNPALVFLLAMLLCGTVEYFTGVVIEHIFGCRWWDYTPKRIHLHGRICLSGVLLFGFSGAAAVCGFGPILNDNIGRIWFPVHVSIVAVLGILFIVDLIVSAKSPNTGKGVTYDINTRSKESDVKEETEPEEEA